MYQIKKWAIAMMVCGFSTMALADWEPTNLVDERDAGGGYTKCIYETAGGFRFSMISRVCTVVEVNPETGKARKI
ncbi:MULTISPECIES: hypothetical protein [unclassified Pasteurella]|uniref:hypothetical protein n=1 Tax=unclassified Pasteurella TaxID=2621516 RepID=UPI0010732107|nr:hypothetical protein [Pasteurella sp. 19428wF3_WM03]TFU51308.1 hypothetical protein E4T92_05740 [Pasteurella sp. WM03]